MKILLPLLIVFSSMQAMSKPAAEFAKAENIGVHTVQYMDGKRNRPVAVEVWYPTHLAGPIDQPEDPVWVHPQEVRDVPIAEGKYPLIVMSHGHGGDKRDRSWLVEYLVKNGFVVASVEHYGNSWKNYNPLLTLRFWERAKDVSFALSQLIKDPLLKKQINAARIGFIGYSMGGMTGLSLSGVKAQNVKQIALQFIGKYKEVDKINLEMVEKTDFSEAQGNFTDRRIKAFALLSPATFAMPPESFNKVKAPVALVVSEADEILPHEDHGLKIVQNLKPTKLKIFQDRVSHYVFLNKVSEMGKNLLRADIQTESIEADRLTVHEEVGQFLISFFKEHLR